MKQPFEFIGVHSAVREGDLVTLIDTSTEAAPVTAKTAAIPYHPTVTCTWVGGVIGIVHRAGLEVLGVDANGVLARIDGKWWRIRKAE